MPITSHLPRAVEAHDLRSQSDLDLHLMLDECDRWHEPREVFAADLQTAGSLVVWKVIAQDDVESVSHACEQIYAELSRRV